MDIRLHLVSACPIIYAGTARMLKGTDVVVTGRTSTGAQAVRSLKRRGVDAVLLDARLPQPGSVAALEQIRAASPAIPVILFSHFDSLAFISRIRKLGAGGYLSQRCTRSDLVTTIRQAVFDKSVWTKRQLRRVNRYISNPDNEIDDEMFLTDRERQVLAMIVDGLANTRIAEELSVSFETAKSHVKQVLRRLYVEDRTQAAVFAVRRGIC